jgi:hypothetical protein
VTALRDALIAAGVLPTDIDQALRDSRRVVGRAAAGARLLSKAAEQIGSKAPAGSKRQAVAVLGSLWLDRVAEQTAGLLRPK